MMKVIHGIRPVSSVIDLNVILYNRRSSDPKYQGAPDEYSAYRLRSGHGFSAAARVSEMRPALSGGLQNPEIHVPRPVLLSGLCPTDLPGKPPRYRVLPANHEEPALSYGHPRPHLPQQLGQRQRSAGLAHLRRFRPSAHRRSASTLPRRGHRPGPQEHNIRFRFHHDRPVPVAFSLGPIPQTQGRHQAPYASRLAWIDPLFYPYDRRKNARCPDPRRSPARTRLLLYLGPGVSGLLLALHSSSTPSVFRHPGQVELPVAPGLLAGRR